jgi:hypothetical protein
MKHILNDLTKEEKNSILEQYTGGKKIMIENFNKLLNSTLGDSKPLMEEVDFKPIPVGKEVFFDVYKDDKSTNKLGSVAMGVIEGPDTMGDKIYKLAATDKSEFPKLMDGNYLYELGYLTTTGGNYILRVRK